MITFTPSACAFSSPASIVLSGRENAKKHNRLVTITNETRPRDAQSARAKLPKVQNISDAAASGSERYNTRLVAALNMNEVATPASSMRSTCPLRPAKAITISTESKLPANAPTAMVYSDKIAMLEMLVPERAAMTNTAPNEAPEEMPNK